MRERLQRAEQVLIARCPMALACAVFCCVSALLVFVLPFYVPVTFHPVISASYVAGFSNRAAAIAAAAMSVTAALWSMRRQQLTPHCSERSEVNTAGLPRLLVLATIALTMCVTALCGWALHVSGQRYLADAGYFIEQISKYVEHRGSLYSQIEFAYGPLLFYPTVFLQKLLHCSTFCTYFATLAMEQAIGLLEFAFVLNSLPLGFRARRLLFIAVAIGAISPLLGLNYTLFRYVTPVALLLLAGSLNSISVTAVVLAIAQMISFALSAEMGVAFAFGSTVLLVWKAKQLKAQWLLALGGPLVGGVCFAFTVGHAYFRMLAAFAGGALNLPVSPYPHLVVFLLCAVWLVPFAVGQALASPSPSTQPIVACYTFALALLPSSLGRCDPLHVFFNGLFFLVLSPLALRNARVHWKKIWAVVLVLFVGWQVIVTNRLFRFRSADTLSAVLPARGSQFLATLTGENTKFGRHLLSDSDDYQLDVNRLGKAVGSALVATPLEITPDVEDALKSSSHFQSSYFAYMVDTFSAPTEQRAIDEMNSAEWALVPRHYERPFLELPNNLQDLQGLPIPLPQRRNVPYVPGTAMEQNLKENWIAVDTLGPYSLLRHVCGSY